MKEIKEIKETNQEMTYEEALKAFKAQWKEKRAEESKKAKQAEKEKTRKVDCEKVDVALQALSEISTAGQKELQAVITRLDMFKKGERYTRNKGGNN